VAPEVASLVNSSLKLAAWMHSLVWRSVRALFWVHLIRATADTGTCRNACASEWGQVQNMRGCWYHVAGGRVEVAGGGPTCYM
jgi:hypothetical protein